MAAKVYLDEIERHVAPLEALAVGKLGDPGYPLPPLRVAGPPAPRRFVAVVLENEFLRALLLPELGGRIVSLIDRRTETECLDSNPVLEFAEGGPRGVWVPAGIQWMIGEPVRPMSMSELDVQIVESDEDAARAVLFEAVPGRELSWHLWLELPSDRAELRVEWRALNRSLTELPFESGVFVGGVRASFQGWAAGVCLYRSDADAGIAIQFEPEEFEGAFSDPSGNLLRRTFPHGGLAPRQTDHAHFTIAPVVGIGTPAATGKGVTLALSPAGVALQASRSLEGSAFVLTAGGETLEAPIVLTPQARARIDWPVGMPSPEAIVLRSKEGAEILRWPTPVLPEIKVPSSYPSPQNGPGRRDPRRRAGSAIEAAHLAIADNRTEVALEALDEAITFNGDDPLAWWLKAAVARFAGSDEEGPELPNAHFLAPMEPMLRVEAFLGQSAALSGDPNPLIAPLAESPDLLNEAAVRLLESGLIHDAARFLDECFRHRDLPMLRYLSAANFLKRPGLEAEAAVHVAAAGRLAFGPPFPWREAEAVALRSLVIRFSDDPALRRYRDLIE